MRFHSQQVPSYPKNTGAFMSITWLDSHKFINE